MAFALGALEDAAGSAISGSCRQPNMFLNHVDQYISSIQFLDARKLETILLGRTPLSRSFALETSLDIDANIRSLQIIGLSFLLPFFFSFQSKTQADLPELLLTDVQCRWVAIAVVSPEVMLYTAGKQWFSASRLCKKLTSMSIKKQISETPSIQSPPFWSSSEDPVKAVGTEHGEDKVSQLTD